MNKLILICGAALMLASCTSEVNSNQNIVDDEYWPYGETRILVNPVDGCLFYVKRAQVHLDFGARDYGMAKIEPVLVDGTHICTITLGELPK